MTAGYKLKARVWRYTFPSDDEVGGAQVSGSVAYLNIDLRLQAIEPDQVFLQQGLETLRTFRGTIRPASLTLYERDELEITRPPSHPLYGRRLRVDGISFSNFHPSDYRGYLIVSLSRSERAHASQ